MKRFLHGVRRASGRLAQQDHCGAASGGEHPLTGGLPHCFGFILWPARA